VSLKAVIFNGSDSIPFQWRGAQEEPHYSCGHENVFTRDIPIG